MNNKVKQFLEDHYGLIFALITVVTSQLICYGLLRVVLFPLVEHGLIITLAIWLVVILNAINLFWSIVQDKWTDRINRKFIESGEEFAEYKEKTEDIKDSDFISLNEVVEKLGVSTECDLNSIFHLKCDTLYTDVSIKMSDYIKLKFLFDNELSGKTQSQKEKEKVLKKLISGFKEIKDE